VNAIIEVPIKLQIDGHSTKSELVKTTSWCLWYQFFIL